MKDGGGSKENKSKGLLGEHFLKGSAGMGKTARAKAMAEEIMGNPAGYTGVETIKDKDDLKKLLKNKYKNNTIIIFDELEKFDEPALMDAARRGDIDAAQAALDAGEDINQGNILKGTALHAAVKGGHMEMCRFLVKAGIDVNAIEHFSGFTPLHSAMEKGRDDIAVFLAVNGARLEPPQNSILGLGIGGASNGGLLVGQPGKGKTQAPPPEDKFSPSDFDRIRTKISQHQVRRAKNLAVQRKRVHIKGRR